MLPKTHKIKRMTWVRQEPAYFSTAFAVLHKYPKDTNLALP